MNINNNTSPIIFINYGTINQYNTTNNNNHNCTPIQPQPPNKKRKLNPTIQNINSLYALYNAANMNTEEDKQIVTVNQKDTTSVQKTDYNQQSMERAMECGVNTDNPSSNHTQHRLMYSDQAMRNDCFYSRCVATHHGHDDDDVHDPKVSKQHSNTNNCDLDHRASGATQPNKVNKKYKMTNQEIGDKVMSIYQWNNTKRDELKSKIIKGKIAFKQDNKWNENDIVNIRNLFNGNVCKVCGDVVSNNWSCHAKRHVNVCVGLTVSGKKRKLTVAGRWKSVSYDENGKAIIQCTVCDVTFCSHRQFANHCRVHAKAKKH